MPVTVGASLSALAWVIPTYDVPSKQQWFATNTAAGYSAATTPVTQPKMMMSTTLYDDSDVFVNWQLANVKTTANDTAVGTLAKYTDGYAMHVQFKISTAVCEATKACGFCIQAAGSGASCSLWKSTAATTLADSTQKSLWIPEADFVLTTNALNTLYADAIAATPKYNTVADDITGFNGNWACKSSSTTVGSQAYYVQDCNRFLPKTTKTNAYTADFRFSPKLVGAPTTFTTPAFTGFGYTDTTDGNWGSARTLYMQTVQETMVFTNASALVMTAALALTSAILI